MSRARGVTYESRGQLPAQARDTVGYSNDGYAAADLAGAAISGRGHFDALNECTDVFEVYSVMASVACERFVFGMRVMRYSAYFV